MDDAHTILLVEDDDATRTFLADHLTADGYDLLVADCVRDGARLLESKVPDLSVLDVGPPAGPGRGGRGVGPAGRRGPRSGTPRPGGRRPRLARRPDDAAARVERARERR